ncbi:MAG: acyltransferase family protein [Eubacterium sp.]|nr:acyltransferase family protein [Eubacterium sp.]
MESKYYVEREINTDILRIVAIFSVIVLHVSAQKWSELDTASIEWNTLNLYNGLVRWCVPVLIMISGSLFLTKNQSIKKIYKKNIFRIVTAFLFWTSFYASIMWIEGAKKNEVMECLVKGKYHLWFLPMIMGVYMIVPFLYKVVNDKELFRYFCILSFVFMFLIMEGIKLLQLKNRIWGELVQSGINQFHLDCMLGFAFYFVIGYFFSSREKEIKWTKGIYIGGFIGFVLTIVLSSLLSLYLRSANDFFYGSFTINVLLESIFVFCVFKKIFSNIKFSDTARRIIVHLSKYSFGIYLVHVFVLDMLEKKGLDTLGFNPIISVPVISIIVFLISLCISAVLNQIPIVKKYIV